MVAPPNLSADVRAKVKAWLDLQPRGVQARMADFMGVKAPALSNYVTGKRRSMRADNIGRAIQFLRLHAPELAIDVPQTTEGAYPDTPHDLDSAYGRAVDQTRLLQQLTALEKENATLRAAFANITDIITAARKTQSIAARPRRRR